MSEYYKNPLDNLNYYRLENEGNLFELDIMSGQWNEITEYKEFSPEWEQCEEDEINYFRLFIYVEQSSKYFAEHSESVGITDYKYGDNFDFYITSEGVVAVDENHYCYQCSPKIILPMMQTIMEIPEDWAKLALENAMDYIENLEGIFLTDMELYYDENGDVQGFTKDMRQFKLTLKTGELNEVFHNIGINEDWKECSIADPIFDDDKNEIVHTVEHYKNLCSLHEYLELTGDYGKYFVYYENPFGCVYAIDESGQEYLCSEEGLEKIPEGSINRGWMRINRFFVPGDIETYYKRKSELPTKEITLMDMVIFISPFDEINGITEDNRLYMLSKEDGELHQIESSRLLYKSWLNISVAQAMKIQAIYKGEAEYRNYIEYFRGQIEAEGVVTPGEDFKFFGEPLGENDEGIMQYNFYAIDNLYNEYSCSANIMELIKPGTVSREWDKIENCKILKYLNN